MIKLQNNSINVAVVGASGYTGAETVRLLAGHPHANLAAITADRKVGLSMGAVYPHLDGESLPKLEALSDVDWDDIDAVFCCLPHGTTQKVIATLPEHLRIVDLSADFRLRNMDTYATWYGQKHQAPKLQKTAVYGLTEIYRSFIANCRLVACPGCYPTSVLLPLVPLLKSRVLQTEDIIIDSKSGVSGAGRIPKETILYAEVSEGLVAYAIANHRHAPEIEQELSTAANTEITISFTPHLTPMNRGILSTIYVQLADGVTIKDLRNILTETYSEEFFVHIAPQNIMPATRHVRGSNHCLIGLFEDRLPNRAIIISVIDNLVKGASGQALQNFNLLFNLKETTGLKQRPLFQTCCFF